MKIYREFLDAIKAGTEEYPSGKTQASKSCVEEMRESLTKADAAAAASAAAEAANTKLPAPMRRLLSC